MVASFVHHGEMDQSDLVFKGDASVHITAKPFRSQAEGKQKQNRKRPPSFFHLPFLHVVNPRSTVSKAAPTKKRNFKTVRRWM